MMATVAASCQLTLSIMDIEIATVMVVGSRLSRQAGFS
jgi:hypothetical protein